MTIAEHTARARDRLVASGIPAAEAALDARLLARHVLGWDLARLVSNGQETAADVFSRDYDALVTRRARREPVAYILGEREFWGRSFAVTRDVLIPRPETELIIDSLLQVRPDAATRFRAADIGTGSGCLAVTLAAEYPAATVVATDTSAAALEIARANARRHGVADRVTTFEADLLPPSDQSFDVVVSNPPYVSSVDRQTLAPEVRDFEPDSALYAGTDGLRVIRRLVQLAPDRLAEGGLLLFEFGYGQSAEVGRLISAAPGLTMIELRRDLQSIPRIAIVRRT
ncbi:MAG TPA: peptide chain release factor N(5)-glutamine methyltransferase [Vicinamibacterales bacterium]|nr:peptide chain release factor N(5)-glutamine methyltransferase [Vicinamibacterales bacterium]